MVLPRNSPGHGHDLKAIFLIPLKYIFILQEESGETVCGDSNRVAVWLCPLCQQGLPDRGSLALHLNDGHSVLPNCVDKLLDIVSSATLHHMGLQNLTCVSVIMVMCFMNDTWMSNSIHDKLLYIMCVHDTLFVYMINYCTLCVHDTLLYIVCIHDCTLCVYIIVGF